MFVKPALIALSAMLLSYSVFAPVAQAEEPYQVAQLRKVKKKENLPPARILPKFYARHVAEGNKLLEQNRLNEAMDEFFVAKTINPDYYPTYIGIGRVYMKQGRYLKAAQNYRDAVKLLNPSYASEHVKDGKYYMDKKRYQLAIKSYWEVLRIDPQAGNQYTLAMRHLRFNNEKAAIKAFEQSIKMDEDYPEPHFQLGNVYFRNKKYNKAVPAYVKAVDLAPRSKTYNFYAGNAYYTQGSSKKKVNMSDIKKAIGYFERAMQLGQKTANIHFNLGTSYLLDSQYDQSIAHLKTYIGKQVKGKKELDADVFYNLGNAYFKKAMTIDFKWDERTNLAHSPLESQKNNTKFDYLTKAIVSYHRALEKKDDIGQLYFDLGVAYYRVAELKPVYTYVDKYIKLRPDVEKDYATRGMRFFQLDMLTRSIENFRYYTSYGSDRKAKKIAYQVIEELTGRLKDYQ